MNKWMFSSIIALAVISGIVLARTLISDDGREEGPGRTVVYTNNQMIDGLYQDLNLKDSMAVFRYVFSRLDPQVTVYPSESYFYFKFAAKGRVCDGAIMLFPPARDSGIVKLGYIMRIEDKVRQRWVPMPGGSATLTRKDGLVVNKIDDFQYVLSFEGKDVTFKLFNDSAAPPKLAKLRSDEKFVGPSFDESGLRFFLIFNDTSKTLYWVLNEDGFVPEEFQHYSQHVAIGVRTGYAFYVDSANSRKILIGVDGLNTLQNNWYDGPFDQMPDNYVAAGMISVQKYLAAAYHLPDTVLDKYGRFKGADSRLPVAPYTVYYERDDLKFVDSCIALNLPTADFYHALCRQRYTIPKEFQY